MGLRHLKFTLDDHAALAKRVRQVTADVRALTSHIAATHGGASAIYRDLSKVYKHLDQLKADLDSEYCLMGGIGPSPYYGPESRDNEQAEEYDRFDPKGCP